MNKCRLELHGGNFPVGDCPVEDFPVGTIPLSGNFRGAIVQRVIIWVSTVRGATTVGGFVLEPFTDI